MAKEVKVPKISEDADTANVAEILVSEGDKIEKDQSIISLETDKASVEVPSSDAGTVKEIKISEGDEVSVGDVILTLEEDGDEEEGTSKEKEEQKEEKEKEEKEDSESEEEKKEKRKESRERDQEKKSEEEKSLEKKDKKEEKKSKEEDSEEKKEKQEEKEQESEEKEDNKSEKGEPEEEEHEETKEGDKDSKKQVPASPGVRRLARELGVDLSSVEGSGSGGRITEEDVKSHSKEQGKRKADSSKKLSLPDFSKWGQTERKSLSNIRMATAKGTTASWQNLPHVFQFGEADISGIEEYIKKNKEKAEEAGAKLTITAILLKIAAGALRQFPKFNASIDLENEEMILKKYTNIGVLVDTEKGLLPPVIRDVDQKSIIELAVEISEMAKKARNQELSQEEMEGGNFTISNLGGIGGTNFTPIIYHPQVAILGISKAQMRPVFIEGEFVPRKILPLSLSYDHRLIDGVEGAEFIEWIRQALEDPYKALLGA